MPQTDDRSHAGPCASRRRCRQDFGPAKSAQRERVAADRDHRLHKSAQHPASSLATALEVVERAPTEARSRPGCAGSQLGRFCRNYFVAFSAASAVTSPAPVASLPQLWISVAPPGSATVREPAGKAIAEAFKIVSAAAAFSDGFFWHISATTPATCGLLIEVPLK